MADFDKAYNITLGNEGGYANNPNDRGGETYKGVARKMNPKWSGWQLVDAARSQPGFPKNLDSLPELQKQIRAFYKENYWNKLNLDQVSLQAIANELFDTAVNCGTGVAAVFLQRALNVTNRAGKNYPNLQLDGQVGSRTLTILNAHHRPMEVLKTLNILQGAKYIEICEARESQEEFYSSWLSRVSL